jgi:protein phosphatase
MAQKLKDEGALKQEEAEETKLSHVLWNGLGGHSRDLKPYVYKATLEMGDAVLLCTDGLTKEVTDPEILKILAAGEPAEITTSKLVDAANSNGGSDNITVVVARFAAMG